MSASDKHLIKKLSDKISLLSLLATCLTIGFYIYQFRAQVRMSVENDRSTEERFDKQFKQIRRTDSLQIRASQQNLSDSKRHFELQYGELKYNDSVQRSLAQKNMLLSEKNFLRQFAELHIHDSTQIALNITSIKNSVRPLLTLWRYNAVGEDATFGILVKNDGAGPAIIDSMIVKYNGTVGNISDIEPFAERMKLHSWSGDMGLLGIPDGAIAQGGKEWIFYIPAAQVTDQGKFRELFKNHVTVIFKYHSMAGDTFIAQHGR